MRRGWEEARCAERCSLRPVTSPVDAPHFMTSSLTLPSDPPWRRGEGAGRAVDGAIYLCMWSVPTSRASCRRWHPWAAAYSAEFVKQRRPLLPVLFLAETIAFCMGAAE